MESRVTCHLECSWHMFVHPDYLQALAPPHLSPVKVAVAFRHVVAIHQVPTDCIMFVHWPDHRSALFAGVPSSPSPMVSAIHEAELLCRRPNGFLRIQQWNITPQISITSACFLGLCSHRTSSQCAVFCHNSPCQPEPSLLPWHSSHQQSQRGRSLSAGPFAGQWPLAHR